MRVYKQIYKNKLGCKKTVKKYSIELRLNKKLHRFTAFENKQASDLLLSNIKQLKHLRDGKLEPSKKLQIWFSDLPVKIQNKLVSLDLLDSKWASSNETLFEHIQDWKQHLKAKGNTADYVLTISRRAIRIIEECDFTYWRDISASRVETYVSDLKLARRTKNFYLKSIKQF